MESIFLTCFDLFSRYGYMNAQFLKVVFKEGTPSLDYSQMASYYQLYPKDKEKELKERFKDISKGITIKEPEEGIEVGILNSFLLSVGNFALCGWRYHQNPCKYLG